MCDFFQESWMTLKDPLTDCPVYERINTVYHGPLSYTKLQYSIRYRFNESVPSAVENKLLRSPEYESLEAKLALLVPICRNILETCPKIWLTVTGIELFTTEDNTLQWRVFEDKDELLTRIPTADLPQHVVKVDISNLEKISMLNHKVFTADYDYETYVLKLHRGSEQEQIFPAEVMARIKAAGLPHINEMEAVVVNNRYDPERSYVEGILLQYCQRGSLESVLKESDPPIDAVTKKRWAAQIAHGIAALHGVGLLHGDLRCGNVVIDDNNDAQIIDISDGCGYTPGWHAYLDDSRDLRRDIYSFGVILWELIHDGDRPPSISTSLPIDWRGKQFDDAFVGLVEECTLEYADKRPWMTKILEILDAESMCGCSNSAE